MSRTSAEEIVDAAVDFEFWYTKFQKLSSESANLKQSAAEKHRIQGELAESSQYCSQAREKMFKWVRVLAQEKMLGVIPQDVMSLDPSPSQGD